MGVIKGDRSLDNSSQSICRDHGWACCDFKVSIPVDGEHVGWILGKGYQTITDPSC